MSTGALHGIVRGRTVILAEDMELPPEGTQVMVTPIAVSSRNNAAILAAVRAGPKLTIEEAAELEQAIAAGR
jgi:hypothetical protein